MLHFSRLILLFEYACCTTTFQNDLFTFGFLFFVLAGDWQFERGSYSYFLGDTINFHVSAFMGNHMPLRVYVDHCVATATPDAEDTLRYDFIEHYG